MRWRKKQKYYPKDNEERVVRKFLIFPKCVDHEYRWLEKVKIRQRYLEEEMHKCRGIFGGDSFYTTGGWWIDIEYVDY